MPDSILLYCEVHRGFGHWMRTKSLAEGIAKHFPTTVILSSDLEVDEPRGAEMIRFSSQAHYPCNVVDQSTIGGALIELLQQRQPAAVLLEYFPFGRHHAAMYLIPFLRAARALPRPALVLSSVRDIQEQTTHEQLRYDKRVVMSANRFIDAVLVHADPTFAPLEESFQLTHELAIPIHYTGYVVPDTVPVEPRPREPVIVVSAGGGRCGERLFRTAIEVQRAANWDFSMRIVGGRYLQSEDWANLQALGADVPRLEFVRWVPDLRQEMARAAVSVSQCGYNTALNFLDARVPTLVVPFEKEEEDEQLFRARKFEKLGVSRLLRDCDMTPATLEREIRVTAVTPPAPFHLDIHGAHRTAMLLQELLAAPRPEALKARGAHAY